MKQVKGAYIMRRKISLLILTFTLAAGSITGCASEPQITESDLQAQYDEGYDAGYEEGYAKGAEEGVNDFRSRQVQSVEYEQFRAFLEQYSPTCIAYVGRAGCPYCSIVTDYMRKLSNLPIPVYYVSLEPYYNTEYYDQYKEELGIDYLPTFIYYKDGVPTYYMNSPATDGYYDTAGEERVAAYGEMTAKIDNFIQGCVNNDDSVNEELERDENTSVE